MKNVWLRAAAVAVGLLAAVLLALLFYLGAIARSAIERGSTYALGVDTHVGSARIGLLSGSLGLSGSTSPTRRASRSRASSASARRSSIFDRETLREATVIAPLLSLRGVEVDLDKRQGKANYAVILENLARFESKEGAPVPAPEPAESASKRFVIRDLVIRDVEAHVRVVETGGVAKLDVVVPEVRVRDLGGEGQPLTLAELSAVVVKAVLASIAKAGVGLPGGIASALSSGLGRPLEPLAGASGGWEAPRLGGWRREDRRRRGEPRPGRGRIRRRRRGAEAEGPRRQAPGQRLGRDRESARRAPSGRQRPSSRSDARSAPRAERAQLLPHDLVRHLAESRRGVEAAVGAGEDAPRVAHGDGGALEALGDHLGMLDVVRRRVDHAGDERRSAESRLRREHAVLVGVARVRHRQHERARAGLEHPRQDLLERHVEVVRPLVVAPADVQAHALRGDSRQARGSCAATTTSTKREELAERPVGEERVALHREIGRIDLEHEARARDRLVLGAERGGDGVDVGLERRVVGVLHGRGDDARRRRGPERLGEAGRAASSDRGGRRAISRSRGRASA